ncbi:MAG TPA: glycosyltransferase family 87 protein, partial [Dietzia sp.]|nr:glycosyltransferase family 87 protein [Dietzia sp.]
MTEQSTSGVADALRVRGLWILAWALSAGLALATIATKGVNIVDFDEVFTVSEDLTVYQDAAVALVNGLPLYGTGDHYRMGGELILTYPPFAAFLFLPMAYTSPGAVAILWQISCLAATAFIIWAVARAEGFRRPLWVAGALLGPATLLYPVESTFHYGQINLLLFALVAADLFGVTPSRFRGVGIGIAASLKLTPLGFILVLLVRRDWASVGRALGTLAATGGGFWILLPAASREYWTDFA